LQGEQAHGRSPAVRVLDRMHLDGNDLRTVMLEDHKHRLRM
jgi:hypothetical protein